MPNIYATPTEIKSSAPDIISPGTTKYDNALLRLGAEASRRCDVFCGRWFYPISETRYYSGNGKTQFLIEDFILISALEYSEDDGANYTALTEAGNWIKARTDNLKRLNYNHPGSYDTIELDANSTILSAWPEGQRSLKITGVFSYSDDRDLAWEDSQDVVKDNPLASGATTLTVNDVDGENLYGAIPRLFAGMIIRIESEFCELTATDIEAETATIIRARNGSAAATHAAENQIDIWRPPDSIKQATAIMCVRSFERAMQGYADTRAEPDVGQLFFMKKIDPEAQEILRPYRIPQSQ